MIIIKQLLNDEYQFQRRDRLGQLTDSRWIKFTSLPVTSYDARLLAKELEFTPDNGSKSVSYSVYSNTGEELVSWKGLNAPRRSTTYDIIRDILMFLSSIQE